MLVLSRFQTTSFSPPSIESTHSAEISRRAGLHRYAARVHRVRSTALAGLRLLRNPPNSTGRRTPPGPGGGPQALARVHRNPLNRLELYLRSPPMPNKPEVHSAPTISATETTARTHLCTAQPSGIGGYFPTAPPIDSARYPPRDWKYACNPANAKTQIAGSSAT